MAFYNIDFTKPGGYPATQDTLRLMQETYRGETGALADALRTLAGVTDPLYALVVSGCELSGVGPNWVVTDGVAAIPGELLAVDGATVAYNESGVRLSVTNEAHPTLDPTTYLYSGSTHSVHLRRRAVVVPYTDPGFVLGVGGGVSLRRRLLDDAQYEDGGGMAGAVTLAAESAWTVVETVRAYKEGLRFLDPAFRRVWLRGVVSYTAGYASTTTPVLLGTLPVGYRPSYGVIVPVSVAYPTSLVCSLLIETDGSITLLPNPVTAIGILNVHLTGVSFMV